MKKSILLWNVIKLICDWYWPCVCWCNVHPTLVICQWSLDSWRPWMRNLEKPRCRGRFSQRRSRFHRICQSALEARSRSCSGTNHQQRVSVRHPYPGCQPWPAGFDFGHRLAADFDKSRPLPYLCDVHCYLKPQRGFRILDWKKRSPTLLQLGIRKTF